MAMRSFQFLTSNLMQTGEDHEGIMGFMPKAIKAEVSRTKKLVSYYKCEKAPSRIEINVPKNVSFVSIAEKKAPRLDVP